MATVGNIIIITLIFLLLIPVSLAKEPIFMKTPFAYRTGGIIVKSVPPDANVYLNGIPQGKTTVNLYNVTSGKNVVTVVKNGYLKYQRTVTVLPNQAVTIEAFLTKDTKQGYKPKIYTNKGILTIQSSPPDAKVYINGEKRGGTPLKLPGIEQGAYNIVVRKSGYKEFSTTARVIGGKETKIKPVLRKL